MIGTSREDFLKAALQAEKNGAKLPKREGQTIEEFITKIWPLLANPKVDSHCTNSAPGEGKDILEESCNSFYRGVTVADLEGFEERHPLNSTLVKRDGKLRELVWRGGFDDVIPPGLYAKQINAIVGHLEDAIPYATPEMARALALLAHYYRTGDPVRFPGLQRRLGRGYRVARRHDQRLHRGLPRRPRPEGGLRGDRLLQRPGEDGAHLQDRRERPVVRGSHVVRSQVP